MSNTKTKKAVKKILSLEERIRATVAAEELLYSRNGLAKKSIVNFPTKKTVPLLGRLGMWLVRVNGGVFDTIFSDVPNK